MSTVHCICHLHSGESLEGALLQIDSDNQQLLLQPQQSTEAERIPFQQLSHLYHNRAAEYSTPGTFQILFANGAHLSGHNRCYRRDSAGHHLYGVGHHREEIHLFIPEPTPHQLEVAHKPQEANSNHIIQQVNQLFEQAIELRASDIHLRPSSGEVEIKLRVDGELLHNGTIEQQHYPAVVSRIKILGNMDIAEHRQPQDGAHHLQLEGRQIDLRISTMPVLDGESVAIRILDPKSGLRKISEIGFQPHDEALFRHLLEKRGGLILVTGPTGSGKSTTLYAAMRALRKQQLNIISIENPVEYRIDRVRQIDVNEATGNTFARNLRHILRHDPDVILVGEIRDEETAHIALQSAYTGHLVLTTLHTGDAPSAIPRLLEMGIEPYTLKDTLLGVLSQRLIRKRCSHCGGERDSVKGCPQCGQSGYHGRLPLYELMPVDEPLRNLIRSGVSAREIRQQAITSGMLPMEAYAKSLIDQQTTHPQEIDLDETT